MANPLGFLVPLKRLDWMALLFTLCLFVVGLVFIHSVGIGEEGLSFWQNQWPRQLLFGAVGFVCYLAMALFDYRLLREWTYVIYPVSLVLMIWVLLFGKEINEARRWIDLGVVDFQPSELVKLGLIVCLAVYLGEPLRNIRHPKVVVIPGLLTGLLFLLIVAQPDLGTALILPMILMSMLFVAGIPWRMIGVLVLVGLMLLPVAWSMARPYQRERILVFLEPDRDPLNASWNMKQSIMAVGSGGLQGKGLGQGTQNLLGFLPTTVAPTDFIFSVIAEEKGFVGSAALLALYCLLFARLTRAAMRAPDRFGQMIAVGILTMLSVHVTINVAMTIGLMPIVGLPLPLVSYGGSFLVSMMLALGLAQSVYVRRI